MREMKLYRSLLLFTLLLPTTAYAKSRNYNDLVLKAVNEMPMGGKYSRNQLADDATLRSVSVQEGELQFHIDSKTPSFCTGATYVVFLKVIAQLQKEENLGLTEEMLRALLITGQPDGTDAWGRWNSNGPGSARLFKELGLGRNFVSFKEARPGDFLKIFFRDKIGKFERGHTVVYLGTHLEKGKEMVRYFSSNTPIGYSIKSSPMENIKIAVFSRLENPEGLKNILEMPRADEYLASMLKIDASYTEMLDKIGIRYRRSRR